MSQKPTRNGNQNRDLSSHLGSLRETLKAAREQATTAKLVNLLDRALADLDELFVLSEPRLPHVLIAEDNPVNRTVAEGMLGNLGCTFESVENGSQAVEAISARAFDLVLMDIHMPVMDGLQALLAIRDLQSEKACLPIVAVTALAQKGDRESLLTAGMDGFIAKPIDPVVLAQTINDLLGTGLEVPPVRETESPQSSSDVENGGEGDADLVSRAILKKLGDDTDPSLLPELISLYLSETERRIESLQDALRAGDDKAVEREAHTIGSSSAAHGLMPLHEVARAIESSYRLGDFDTARDIAREMPELAARSLAELAEIDVSAFWP